MAAPRRLVRDTSFTLRKLSSEPVILRTATMDGGGTDSRGRKKFADGSVYEGQWLKDVMHGRGKFIWPNGDIYEGEFEDGVFQYVRLLQLSAK